MKKGELPSQVVIAIMDMENITNNNSITVEAALNNYDSIMEFIESKMDEYECPMALTMKINVAVDEVIANVINYAYESVGTVTVSVDRADEKDGIAITFFDHGVPFNPLDKEDPDTEANVEDRKIGGLGIFMVKKIMDKVEYSYNGGNILRITKYF